VVLTILIIGGAWAGLASKGAKAFNVEFLGGSEITFTGLKSATVPVNQAEDVLKKVGITDGVVQYEGDLLSVRVPTVEADKTKSTILESFRTQGVQPGETVSIGSQVGKELTHSGIMALSFAIGGILIYLTIRFQFAYAAGAIVALVHDTFITIGIFAACGGQFSLAFISALLAMIGYSTNDTIIVFDRIREEVKLQGNRMSYREICNRSINLTLSRTIITHSVTLISVTALWLLGTGVVKDIAFTMFIGIVTGTFSSIFIATPVMLLWHQEKNPRFANAKVVPTSTAAKAKA
jgi:preprotein translocase SecF subunit